MSLDDIAAAAGVSKALIYEHFRSKEDLYWSCSTPPREDPLERVLAAGSAGGALRRPPVRAGDAGRARMRAGPATCVQMLVRYVSEPAIARHQQERAGRGAGGAGRADGPGAGEQRSTPATQPRAAARMMVGSVHASPNGGRTSRSRTIDEALKVLMGFCGSVWGACGTAGAGDPGRRRAERRRDAEGLRRETVPMSPALTILGIDPGTASTGFGVVESGPGRLRRSRRCDLDGAGEPLERRLAAIARRLDELIAEHRPRRSRSRTSSSGATCGPPSRSGRRAAPSWRSPGARPTAASPTRRRRSSWRSAATAAPEKDQVQRMVAALLGLSSRPRSDHAADALAVAICHANGSPARSRVA